MITSWRIDTVNLLLGALYGDILVSGCGDSFNVVFQTQHY